MPQMRSLYFRRDSNSLGLIVNDIDRVLYVIPSLHQKKFLEMISFKGYSPTDFIQIP